MSVSSPIQVAPGYRAPFERTLNGGGAISRDVVGARFISRPRATSNYCARPWSAIGATRRPSCWPSLESDGAEDRRAPATQMAILYSERFTREKGRVYCR